MCCLALWASVWLLFLLMRFSPFDYRIVPGIGPLILLALVAALLLPIAATGLAAVALIRDPRVAPHWWLVGGSIAVLLGQSLLFLSTRWL